MGKYPLFSEFLEFMVVAEHIFGVPVVADNFL